MDGQDGDKPAPGGTALVIADMVNDLDFGEGEGMKPAVKAAAEAILRLRDEADALGVPVIYVNDNYGRWHSERSKIIEYCLREESVGADIVEMIRPRDNDYFVIKSQFSGFYASSLPVLLPKLKANRLVLTGVAADICVLFTAADAHMREYGLWVPRDAVAAASRDRLNWSLEIMRNSMGAEICPTDQLKLVEWVEKGEGGREFLPHGNMPAKEEAK